MRIEFVWKVCCLIALFFLVVSCGSGGNGNSDKSDGDTSPSIDDETLFREVPDTGQTTSFTDVFGEDSDYEINPHSYTKLDSDGYELPDSAVEWGMVRDNITGLIWEKKTNDDGIHDKDNIYSWEDVQENFIEQLNNDNFGGYSDWRLPTIKELTSLVNSDLFDPAINNSFFPFAVSAQYWSNDLDVYGLSSPGYWYVEFFSGKIKTRLGYLDQHVRAVRGKRLVQIFVDNQDDTVTDNSTGLMWQKLESDEMDFEDALSYCENFELANYTDWRLPNRNELISIVDYAAYAPAIDKALFPDAKSQIYWSSTSRIEYSTHAWYVDFADGEVESVSKTLDQYVRCVR